MALARKFGQPARASDTMKQAHVAALDGNPPGPVVHLFHRVRGSHNNFPENFYARYESRFR
jgi:hypothetical protein